MAHASEIEAPQIIQADEDRPGERGQMADVARHTMRTCHLLGGTTVLGVVIVLALIAVRVARYPASIQGPGNSLLWTNVTLLLVYGLSAIWVSYQSRADVRTALRIGAITGLLLGAVHVANHLIELFVPARNFALVISPVFLMFALRRPNVLPTGDFGVRMAMQKHYKKRKPPNPEQMEKIAKCWEPYRSVACWYLWRSLDI